MHSNQFGGFSFFLFLFSLLFLVRICVNIGRNFFSVDRSWVELKVKGRTLSRLLMFWLLFRQRNNKQLCTVLDLGGP